MFPYLVGLHCLVLDFIITCTGPENPQWCCNLVPAVALHGQGQMPPLENPGGSCGPGLAHASTCFLNAAGPGWSALCHLPLCPSICPSVHPSVHPSALHMSNTSPGWVSSTLPVQVGSDCPSRTKWPGETARWPLACCCWAVASELTGLGPKARMSLNFHWL